MVTAVASRTLTLSPLVTRVVAPSRITGETESHEMTAFRRMGRIGRARSTAADMIMPLTSASVLVSVYPWSDMASRGGTASKDRILSRVSKFPSNSITMEEALRFILTSSTPSMARM